MSQLSEYVKQQINAGYTVTQIESYLLTQGYKKEDVDVAIKESSKENTLNNNPDELLNNYIRNSLNQGYQENQLFTYLLSQGYSEEQLKKAFSKIKKGPSNSKRKSPIKNIALIIILICIFAVGYLYFSGTISFAGQEKIIELSVKPTSKVISENEVSFKIDLTSNFEEEIGVNINYEIKNSKGLVVDSFESKKLFKGETSFTEKRTIKSTENDFYTINAALEYEGKRIESKSTFKYEKENNEQASNNEPEEEIIEEPKEQIIVEKIDEPEEKIITNKPLEKVDKPKAAAEAKGKSDQDLFNYAISQEDRDEALSYCVGIEEDSLSNECYFVTAQRKDDPGVCNLISEVNRKEDCFISFVMGNRVDLCSQITLAKNLVICDQMQQLFKLKGYTIEDSEQGSQAPEEYIIDDNPITDYVS